MNCTFKVDYKKAIIIKRSQPRRLKAQQYCLTQKKNKTKTIKEQTYKILISMAMNFNRSRYEYVFVMQENSYLRLYAAAQTAQVTQRILFKWICNLSNLSNNDKVQPKMQ